jgi:phosphate transport system protein
MTTTVDCEIEEQVLHMFALVSEGITAATAAFVGVDLDIARRLIADDPFINELQRRIESVVEERLMSGVAISPHDARSMIAVLRIVPEIERAGDLVEHIALRTPQRLADEIPVPCRVLLEDMGCVAAEMWRLAADAYADTDPSAAARLRVRDDSLDDLHVRLTAHLAASDISVAMAIEMGLVARFYERLGDHAVNVARRVHGDADNDGSTAAGSTAIGVRDE